MTNKSTVWPHLKKSKDLSRRVGCFNSGEVFIFIKGLTIPLLKAWDVEKKNLRSCVHSLRIQFLQSDNKSVSALQT